MTKYTESSASKVRSIALEFLEANVGREFRRKELEEYIDKRISVTSGSKTGSLNRLLIEKGEENGIAQIERGTYLYDPSKKKIDVEVELNTTEQLQKIMDAAFEEARAVISSIEIVDFLNEDDLDELAKYRELLKVKPQIDNILKGNI